MLSHSLDHVILNDHILVIKHRLFKANGRKGLEDECWVENHNLPVHLYNVKKGVGK